MGDAEFPGDYSNIVGANGDRIKIYRILLPNEYATLLLAITPLVSMFEEGAKELLRDFITLLRIT